MGARIRTFRTIAGDEIHVEVFASHRVEPRVFVSARKLEGGAVEELELSRADVPRSRASSPRTLSSRSSSSPTSIDQANKSRGSSRPRAGVARSSSSAGRVVTDPLGPMLGDRVEVLSGPFGLERGEITGYRGLRAYVVELEEGTRVVEDVANLAPLDRVWDPSAPA